MSQNDSIVQKIQKLLALAEGNQNEHERDVAMRFAMDLLAKHNLSLAQVEGTVFGADVQEFRGGFKLDRWIRPILSAACKLYYTDFYIDSGEWDWWGERRINKRPVFVGTSENIAVTIEVAAFLVESVRLESNRLYKTPYEKRSFRLGASERIYQRAVELVNQEKSAAVSGGAGERGTSLIVIRNQLERINQNYLSTLNLRSTKTRSVYIDSVAFTEGIVFGNQVKLGKEVKLITAR